MIFPGLSTAWKTVVVIAVAAGVMVGSFYAYSAYDRYRQRKRLENLAAGNQHVAEADTLTKQADTVQAQILPTKRGFSVLTSSKAVRSNPVARTVADTAHKIISADSVTIDKQKKAISKLDSAVTEYKNAGPPVGPRAVPYADLGYGASTGSRAVPVVRLGVDYRLLPHVMAKLEGSYEPPPAGSTKQTPELRVLVAGHITFR